MKAVILAGGLGSRLSEETTLRPKPMVEVGGRPILWHILKIYSAHGINEFIICLGYKGHMIKEFFSNYGLYSSDVTFDMVQNTQEYHANRSEPWKVTLVDTGAETMTGGRLRRVLPYVQNDDCFCFTYGDGVSDVNISDEIAYHRSHGKLATLVAAQPGGKYGALSLGEDNAVEAFAEKPRGDNRWINGGFFVLSPKVGRYIQDDATIWEREPLESIAREGEIQAFRHEGFWQPMDTVHDRTVLEQLWASGRAPWKVWE